jgi:diamine N-acetyltransferase
MTEQDTKPRGRATKLTAAATVTLREVTSANLEDILSLDVSRAQKKFVASNAVSIAQAHFEKKAWFRAIYADETPVGFLMLYDDPDTTDYFLWRFMIDKRYQGLSFGRQALELLIKYVRNLPGATELLVSYFPADGGPEPFYSSLGFEHTGQVHDGEKVMKLMLQ